MAIFPFLGPPRSFEARPVGEQVDQNLGKTKVDLLQVGDFKTLKVDDIFSNGTLKLWKYIYMWLYMNVYGICSSFLQVCEPSVSMESINSNLR